MHELLLWLELQQLSAECCIPKLCCSQRSAAKAGWLQHLALGHVGQQQLGYVAVAHECCQAIHAVCLQQGPLQARRSCAALSSCVKTSCASPSARARCVEAGAWM